MPPPLWRRGPSASAAETVPVSALSPPAPSAPSHVRIASDRRGPVALLLGRSIRPPIFGQFATLASIMFPVYFRQLLDLTLDDTSESLGHRWIPLPATARQRAFLSTSNRSRRLLVVPWCSLKYHSSIFFCFRGLCGTVYFLHPSSAAVGRNHSLSQQFSFVHCTFVRGSLSIFHFTVHLHFRFLDDSTALIANLTPYARAPLKQYEQRTTRHLSVDSFQLFPDLSHFLIFGIIDANLLLSNPHSQSPFLPDFAIHTAHFCPPATFMISGGTWPEC